MSFTLEIEFAGLCNFLIAKDKPVVGVVMPDGRMNGKLVKPYDFEAYQDFLVHHAGYLRYNLADLAVEWPTQTPPAPSSGNYKDSPAFEVVHRFDFEELDLGLADAEADHDPQTGNILAADLERIDPHATIRPDLFGARPPAELLMRMVVRGGEWQQPKATGLWWFDSTLLPGQEEPTYGDALSGTAYWRRTIDEKQVTIRMRSWRDGRETMIPLRPSVEGGVVRLKIANLCDRNPMEWPDLNPRIFQASADVDFKWFYFLWRDARGDFTDILNKETPKLLPVPHPHPMHGDVWNCGQSKATVNTLGV